jgi:Methyltransferase domain
MDRSSVVLLYNGSNDPRLLKRDVPFEREGVVLHPQPRPAAWGQLHGFALDCMQFALDHLPFDTLTIVDSDQLATRPGYATYLQRFLATESDVGLLSNTPGRQLPGTPVLPAAVALREIELWRPFLQRFRDGEEKFVHWSFWPSTVFTAAAARDLTRLFATDAQLHMIMQRTRIWATEEVILPTLVALLGYRIEANPCSYDVVQYRVPYTVAQIETALGRPDLFWVHPIPRRYDDPLRAHIRAKFNQYATCHSIEAPLATEADRDNSWLLTRPILKQMKAIEGWLEEDEADLLIAAATHALNELPGPHAIVEVGSYCGRSTVVLGAVAKALAPDARVYAIDPHVGKVGAMDKGIIAGPPTSERFRRNIAGAGLTNTVTEIQEYSYEVRWERPVSFLLIDGLHDYANVARDFHHLGRWVVEGGYIAFHDYADYYPGVRAFVDELIASGEYRCAQRVCSMIVLQKRTRTAVCH